MSRPERGADGHAAVSVLELRGVSKTYGQEPATVHALAGVDLSVRAGLPACHVARLALRGDGHRR
jgi:hypothetical protein